LPLAYADNYQPPSRPSPRHLAESSPLSTVFMRKCLLPRRPHSENEGWTLDIEHIRKIPLFSITFSLLP
jgi:hypothetical protein